MSHNSLDSLETTLRHLKEIVEKSLVDCEETAGIVSQMELLIAEMKRKQALAQEVSFTRTQPAV